MAHVCKQRYKNHGAGAKYRDMRVGNHGGDAKYRDMRVGNHGDGAKYRDMRVGNHSGESKYRDMRVGNHGGESKYRDMRPATTVVSPMFANSGPRKEVANETADVLTAFERYSDAIRLPFEAK